MKTICLLSLTAVLLLSGGCSQDDQDIEREEEMNRGDLIDKAVPDNLDSQPVDLDTERDLP